MKIIIRSVIIASFVCGGVLTASAQSQEQKDYIRRNSDMSAVSELEVQFAKEFQENYSRALELARQRGWPLTINKPDSGFTELKGVTANDEPVYYTTSNDGSARTSRVNRIQPGGAAGLNLDGQGMLVYVWDAGKVKTDHVELNGRVTRADGSSKTVDEHSTHVMGTVLASGIKPAARGMAYKAQGMWADWLSDLTEMANAVKTKSLLVSNHSYGRVAESTPPAQFGAYIQESADLDKLLYASPFYQPVVAAGNDRDNYDDINPGKGGHDLLTGYATSKNAIVVAAVEGVSNYAEAKNVKMSTFSNWGPTDDNRIKPDISDKGVQVYSTTEGSTTEYGYLSGTSMASPGVTGALVLIQQHYGNLNSPAFMRSATLRGLVAHTADEAGTTPQGVSIPGPDSKFGWGLLNAERAVKAISDSKNQKAIVNELTLSEGGSYTTTVLATGNEPLVATISWTDKQGVINETIKDKPTPVLVNDLDVRITKDGATYFPWALDVIAKRDAPAIKTDNIVDNIEKIEVDGAVYGVYTITVTHKKNLIGKDGLPVGVTATQDFSLIVTGIDQQQQILGIDHSDFKEFNVWPNPANDLLNVSIQSGLSEEAFVTLYDVQGKRIINQKLDASNAMFEGSVNIDSLTSGIYLVKVSQGSKQSIRKIIKK